MVRGQGSVKEGRRLRVNFVGQNRARWGIGARTRSRHAPWRARMLRAARPEPRRGDMRKASASD